MNTTSVETTAEGRFNPIPSLFTLCNALCGFTSILYTFRSAEAGIPLLSLWLILGAMLFDVLDGLSARWFKAQSLHGMNLDSLADAISFGAAPAAIIYRLVGNGVSFSGQFPGLAWFVAAFYLGCALWRLAQYNSLAVQDSPATSDFLGLPTPGAAALICAMTILVPALALGNKLMLLLYLAYALISAVLMVSALPYNHLRRVCIPPRKGLIVPMMLAAIAAIVLFKVWIVVALTHLYALHAPLLALESRVLQRRHANI